MRRHKGASGRLQEPLLSKASSSAPAQQRLQPKPRRFNLGLLVALLFQLLRAIYCGLRALLWGPDLTPIQAERLEDLQGRFAVAFVANNPSHTAQLQELWEISFPDEPFTSVSSPRWKEMGWQGEDPTTDFRGAGLLGLQNLVYLGTHYPQLYHSLLHKTEGKRAAWEYPFAAAGINITFMMYEVVGMRGSQPGVPPATPTGRAFCHLLECSGDAFEEMYCMTFALLDRAWLQQQAGYMQFNAVLKTVRGRLEAALKRRPRDLEVLRHSLS